MEVPSKIIYWYNLNKRDLPWRNTDNPYFIWISEVLLQQTRVQQALSYYHAFTSTFPTVNDLANAPEQQVLKLWQGLGYYSRARNMHFSAKQIVNEFNGIFPSLYHDILKLKGVGKYTAAAIASIAFNEKVPVLDGNVFRVISRLYNEPAPIDNQAGYKVFLNLVSQLLNQNNPGEFNQAIMEFGAIQCIPKNPDCHSCILQTNCLAFKNNTVSNLPVKNKLKTIKTRYLNYFFIDSNGHTFIKRRNKNDIWKGLFEFPLIESTEQTGFKEIVKNEEWKNYFHNSDVILTKSIPEMNHQLTHQLLLLNFYFIEANQIAPESRLNVEFDKIKIEELPEFPVPRPIDKFINNYIIN